MRLDDIEGVIRENIPEILSIGDYRGRISKCIDIIKNTRTKYDIYYTSQESNDVVDMLDTYLAEDEAYGYMKEHCLSAFIETNKIVDICRCCLYESKHWQEIPLLLVSDFVYDRKLSILGIKIGDSLTDAKRSLKRYALDYVDEKDGKYYKIDNKFVDGFNNVGYDLFILNDGRKIIGFTFHTTNNRGLWQTMGSLDSVFKGCRYKFESCSNNSASLIYYTYYEDIKVRYSAEDTYVYITSAKQSQEKSKSWWKL